MKRRHLSYWDYDSDASVTCPACAWSGRAGDQENFSSELLDVRCGACHRILLVVSYPTDRETRAAAAAGNPRAQKELGAVEAREARAARAGEHILRDPADLPDVPGDRIRIDWDFEKAGDDVWTVLRAGDVEIWRELAYWEGFERFAEVFDILRHRYGERLQEVRPTRVSELYLYGDRLSAPKRVQALNDQLKGT